MKTELTKEQINALFAFVEKKDVKYYDVQVELVDHIASEIEQKQTLYPTLTFEKALNEVYAGFGIFGFEDFVKNVSIQLHKKRQKRWWQYFRAFWKLPKIIFSLVFFGFVYACFIGFGYRNAMIAHFILLIVYGAGWAYRFINHSYRNKSMLSNSTLTNAPTDIIMLFFSYLTFFYRTSDYPLWLICPVIALFWISTYSTYETDIYFMKEQKKMYPQAFA